MDWPQNRPIRPNMKQYKLAAWPELPAAYHRTVYRRMLSDLSHRYMSLSGLMLSSGGTKPEVRQFLLMLDGMGVLVDREDETDSFFDTTIRPVGDWLRTVFGADHTKL
jgi:hypothetical protein